MDTLKNLTLVQWIGIMVGLNSLLMGATPQLTVLFGTVAVPYIIAIATLGNGALGVFVTVVGGQGAQIRNVAAMPGVEAIKVNANANQTLAAIAVSGLPEAKNVAPIPAAEARVSATAKGLVILFAVMLGSILTFTGDAHAQGKLKLPIDPLGLNNRSAVTSSGSGDPIDKLLDALDAKLLPDLKYALALANASGSKVTAPCYTAWIAIIETRQSAAKNADGSPMGEPDPDIVTKFEKMVELRNALQPESDFMIHCSPVASMVKKDIAGFIGVVLSGGAGLATLVPGL